MRVPLLSSHTLFRSLRAPVPAGFFPPLSLRRLATAAVSQPQASASSPGLTRGVGLWLAGTAGLVFGMVSLGGVTRLTRSGLSIVEWRPEGEVLPSTPHEWQVAFDRYKSFPEYQRANSRMTLEEFKPIYFMEWAHRAWGRGLGLVFGLPLLALAATRSIPAGLAPRLGLLLALGGAQGAIGWWMVRSGLESQHFEPGGYYEYQRPRVSPYRLATHLTGAWTLYSVLAWTAMDLLRASPAAAAAAAAAATGSPAAAALQHAALRSLALPTGAALTLLAVTTVSGAFVAGNDAGHAYNDWPLFAGRWVPEDLWLERLGLRNLFENTATVQFNHRTLAYSTVAAVGGAYLALAAARRSLAATGAAAGLAPALPPALTRACMLLKGAVLCQALLGITTLIHYVPVSLGAAHQAGALATWTAGLYYAHVLRSATVAAAAAAAEGGVVAGGAGRLRVAEVAARAAVLGGGAVLAKGL